MSGDGVAFFDFPPTSHHKADLDLDIFLKS